MSKFIMGFDAGYSNLICSYGEQAAGEPERVIILPAGAGPLELLDRDAFGDHRLDGAARILIDGVQWAAGIQPERFSGKSRELHSDYPATNVYKALFYAGLAMAERDVIDVLITGLPVNQFYDSDFREQLSQRLKGEHQISPKKKVTVKDVLVVPQPAGSYLTALEETGENDELAASLESGMALVLDAGFFSVDWVTVEDGNIATDTADTDLRAMSRVLEATADLMHEDYGARPEVSRIERAVRGQQGTITFQGKKIDFTDYYNRAAKQVADSVLVALRSSMRDRAGSSVDAVILGGGGGACYEVSARETFPNAVIAKLKNPVTSNAVGFWHGGRDL